MKHPDLDKTTAELVRQYGVNIVIHSLVSACDASADFAHSCNDKTTENYWRKAAVAILDIVPKLPENRE